MEVSTGGHRQTEADAITPDEIAAALDAFERSALLVAAIRVPVRKGRTSADDVRRHAARTAAQFFFATVWKRTERAALPGDAPEPPVRVRGPVSRHRDDQRGD